MEYEQSEISNGSTYFDELDQARESLMIFERDKHVFSEEVEAVMDYIDLKLTQKVKCQDLAKGLRSEAQLQYSMKPAIKDKQKHDQKEGMKQQSVFQ